MQHKNVTILNYDMAYNDSLQASNVEKAIKVNDQGSYDAIIKNQNNWEVTNALSEIRSNCIEWLPFKKTDRVLEIGCGYGAVSEMLSRKVGRLHCIEKHAKMCSIAAERTELNNNTSVYLGTIEDLLEHEQQELKYDYIIMLGSFSGIYEYLRNGEESDNAQIEALNLLKTVLDEDGTIVIAEDNKLGLKFWNGAKIDPGDGYFALLEGQSESRRKLFTKSEYDAICKEAGFSEIQYFYPYPDYKYPLSIYSDEHLPKENELYNDIYNWEESFLNLFCESKVYNSIIKENMFPYFSNSFILLLEQNKKNNVNKIFVKYSNERSPAYRIKTEIVKKENGGKEVYKIPLNHFSERHLKEMFKFFNEFSEQSNSQIKLNVCRNEDGVVACDFIEGELLSDKLRLLISKKEYEEVKKIVRTFFENLQGNSETSYFVPSNMFKKVFGNVELPDDITTASFKSIDLIFPNVIVSDDGVWNVIDYEWTFDFPIPLIYIFFRSIFYLNGSSKSFDKAEDMIRQELYCEFGISDELKSVFLEMEHNFQRYVRNGITCVRHLKPYDGNIFVFKRPVEVFLDSGEGFTSELSYKNDSIIVPGVRSHIVISVSYNWVKRMRIDPYSDKCIIRILSVTNGYGVKIPFSTNGRKLSANSFYAFRHKDPQIICSDLNSVVDKIVLDIIVYDFPSEDALK